jgi:hypothetical protein
LASSSAPILKFAIIRPARPCELRNQIENQSSRYINRVAVFGLLTPLPVRPVACKISANACPFLSPLVRAAGPSTILSPQPAIAGSGFVWCREAVGVIGNGPAIKDLND